MFNAVLKKVFGSRNERLLKNLRGTVTQVNALEPAFKALTDEALARKTVEFRERAGRGEALDALLPEAFAVVREAARRTLDMRHFDVQIIGGMVLHTGKIAEMRTGEGKTLVATLPAYLNALAGRPVHIVTVNDYLARRDADWMGQIYRFLGLEVGVIASGQDPAVKRAAYLADIVYGTNNEYGFDYLRDNMAFTQEDRFQRGLGFAVVDEVDSILIDEARTPLIISGPAEESTELYQRINTIVPRLTRQPEENAAGDYHVDEKNRQVYLSEEGHDHAERLLAESGLLGVSSGLYDVTNITLLHHLYAGLRAHALFQRDVDYIVRDGQIVIIDEFTGRMMVGRRWSDGLHQAVEAKEGVKVQQENQTLASITFQNYFRLYEKLSGMTGTADTEAVEFQQIYNLEVVVIPTHRPMVRDDRPDLVYRTRDEKFRAVIKDVKDCHTRRQPVLLGTTSIETSEYLANLMAKESVPHQVLNAKQHEREAQIVAQAGRPGSVTIATNMAGRGTDIVLGGSPAAELAQAADDGARAAVRAEWQQRHDEVVAAGGLHIIGTERHESRRVDNQLRGRSGRQGDPGSSRFYLSLEDSLMRIFGSERLSGLMQKLGMQEDEAIEHPWVTRAIENAQRKVEGRNFDIRKQLLEYDDIANEQRKIVYRERNNLMDTDDVSQNVAAMRRTAIDAVIARSLPPQSLEEQWNLPALEEDLEQEFGLKLPVQQWLEADKGLHEEPLRERIRGEIEQAYARKEERVGAPVLRHLEKAVTLQVLDTQWKEHLANMDYLRQGIGLRGYAQKNPKQEYKREAFELFSAMLDRVRYEVVAILLARIQVREESDVEALEAQHRQAVPMEFVHPEATAEATADEAAPPAPASAPPAPMQPIVRAGPKVGRNDPCPCGSGKKYKQCHGKL